MTALEIGSVTAHEISNTYGKIFIPKNEDNRCFVCADAGVLACEDFGVRLHPRNITISKDRAGFADRIIKTCIHPFALN